MRLKLYRPLATLIMGASLISYSTAEEYRSVSGVAENGLTIKNTRFKDLHLWHNDQHHLALAAFKRSCSVFKKASQNKKRPGFMGTYGDWASVCVKAQNVSFNQVAARKYFEENFLLAQIIVPGDKGLFTGHFEPTFRASLKRSPRYNVPLYRKSKNQVRATRAEIENGALENRNLDFVYLQNPIDAFFLHIQGSGRLLLANGKTLRVGFEAKNNQPYTAIGKFLIDQNEISREDISMQSIRCWLEDNPQRSRHLMQQNASFIFFKPLKNIDPNLGPPGALGVPLTPQRSLAIDKSLHGLGMPMWLETEIPTAQNGVSQLFHHLMVAQDTGSAIKGAIRGDIFWGAGNAAGETAGKLKQSGKLYILLPKALAAKPMNNAN